MQVRKKKLIVEPLKHLASEVMNILKSQAGTTLYVSVYQFVHDRVQTQRREKREKRAIQAVTDPKARAQERVRKNVQKQKGRKRKAQEFATSKLRMGHSKKMSRTS